MNTVFLLMAEFNQADIPLEVVAEKYLSMTKKEAYRRANLQELPFPAFRGGETQKAPQMVRITDLAEYLDSQREKAKKDWAKMNA